MSKLISHIRLHALIITDQLQPAVDIYARETTYECQSTTERPERVLLASY